MYRDGFYEEAEKSLLESEQKDCRDFRVHRTLATIYLNHLNNQPRSLEYYRKAAKFAKPRDIKQSAECHLSAAYHLFYR